jgi:hypothetical protein
VEVARSAKLPRTLLLLHNAALSLDRGKSVAAMGRCRTNSGRTRSARRTVRWMRARTGAAIVTAATAVAVAVVLLSSDGSDTSPPSVGPAAGSQRASPPVRPGTHPRGSRMDCSTRSGADFPEAFTDPRNLVVGPLVLDGGAAAAHDPVSVIRRFHGQKIPMLVKTGHTVTVRIPRRARGFAGLGYTPQGRVLEEQVGLRDTRHTVTFVACRPGEPSGSDANGQAVTFWSGAVVVTRAPACVPLDVYVDDEPSPRRVVLSLAAGRCPAARTQVREPSRPPAAPVLNCQERVEGGRIAPQPGRNTVIGRLAFATLPDFYNPDSPSRVQDPPAGLNAPPIKGLALVPAGSSLTLAVPHHQRSWMLLFYEKSAGSGGEGRHAITLRACRHFKSRRAQRRECAWEPSITCRSPYTQFAGEIYIDYERAPRQGACADLLVWVEGDQRPHRGQLFPDDCAARS